MPKQAQNQNQEQIRGMDATPEQQEKLVHLGKMLGHPSGSEFDQEVHEELVKAGAIPHEAGYEKMHEAQMGLAPTDIEKEQSQQQTAQAKTQATQQAQTASQAQAQQSPVNAPPAPAGPVGVSTPFPAQNAPGGPPSAQDVEPEVPGMQSPASQIQPPPAPDQGQ